MLSISKYCRAYFFVGLITTGLSAQIPQLQQIIPPEIINKVATIFGTAWTDTLKLIQEGKPIGLSNLPFLNQLDMPATIKEIFNKIVFHKPWFDIVTTAGLKSEPAAAGVAVKGKVDLFGVPVNTMLYFGLDSPEGVAPDVSLLVVIPNVLKIGQLVPQLTFLDSFTPPFVVLALSTSSYEFKQVGVRLEPGANILLMLEAKGGLEKITDLLGERMNVVEVYGVINPEINGTSLTGILPGRLKLGPFETTGLKLKLAIVPQSVTMPGVFVPHFSIETGFQVTWPLIFKEPQLVQGAILVAPDKLQISAWTKGKMDLPSLPGAHVELHEVGLTGEAQWAQLVGTGGTIPISGAGFRGKIALNPALKEQSKELEAAVKVAYTTVGGIGDFVLQASMSGYLSLEEVIDFGALQIKEATAGQINLKPQYAGKIPDLAINNPHLYVVPKSVELAGKSYEPGVKFGGDFKFLDALGTVNFSISLNEGIRGLGFVTNTQIGALKITGSRPEEKGARVDFRIGLDEQQKLVAYFYLSGKIVLDILGGISSDTVIAIKVPEGLYTKSTTKLFDKFEADLEIRAALAEILKEGIKPENFFITGHMRQTLMKYIEEEMNKFAHGIVPDFDKKSFAEFERVETELRRLHKELAEEWQICRKHNWPDSSCALFWDGIVRRNLEVAGLNVYRDLVLKPWVPVARGVVGVFSNTVQFAAGILGKGFNITEFTFDGRLTEFTREGKLPRVNIKGTVVGCPFELKDLQFNFGDIHGSTKYIFEQLFKDEHVRCLVGQPLMPPTFVPPPAPSPQQPTQPPTIKLNVPVKVQTPPPVSQPTSQPTFKLGVPIKIK